MNARVIELTPTLRMVAASERQRLTGFLGAIDTARQAEVACNAFDTTPALDSRAARDALDASVVAEDRVLALALDPGLAVFLQLILTQLTDIAGEVECV